MHGERVVYRAAEAAAARVREDWGTLSWKASAALGNASGHTLGIVTIKAGASNPRHAHPTTEESLHLLSGRLRHSLGEAEYTLEAGDTLHIPAGVFHHAESLGPGDAEMIVVYDKAQRDFVLEDRR